MNFELKSLDLAGSAALTCDALVVLVAEGFKPARDALSQLIEQARKAGDFETKPGKLLAMYKPAAAAAARLVLVGCGDGSPKQVRQAVASAVGAVKSPQVKKLVVCFADAPAPLAVRCAVQAAAEASYVYTTTKSKAEGRSLAGVTIAVPDAGAVRTELAQGKALVAGIEFAKEWGNRPANHATPTLLAGAARTLARFPRIKCEVLGPKEVEKLGMLSFMSVAQGSKEPLRFIVLRYEGAARTAAPSVLVGKGITFDTGGISIKPSAEMDEMKFDMCGAASVLGVFRTLADLQPAMNVVGLIPACENMPDGGAVKPSDVVTSMSGQTIENLNTDAEGRLVLCDALTYAERFKPRAVIDIATLTGACVVALGGVRSGLFSADDALAEALLAAGESALDLCWRLPLDDEYGEGLKSNFADMANVAGRAGGAVTAAKFLQKFTAKMPWAHLDIAGTAWKSGAAKGSTGRPVGLLVDYLLAHGDKAPAPSVEAKARRAQKTPAVKKPRRGTAAA
ncbi:leucyl aminopeptidase [Rhodoferax koreense]|uniref:Probable cytosol aminopeptidase n=1 Tax=Rhodoferax koreensis TaxID=1842727 RepID=A0A1P8JWK5_9BURK|nr:leucyl aminopeptidase [Rhodoferax koreense]APW38133.1 leucyl aminopeptidase [Rhodoferax koreense]